MKKNISLCGLLLVTLSLVSCSDNDKPSAEKLGKEIAEAQMSGKDIEVIKESLKYCQWGGYGYSGNMVISNYDGSSFLYSSKKYLTPIVNENLGKLSGELLSYYTDVTPKGWFSKSYCQKVYKAYLKNVQTNLGQFEVISFSNTEDIFSHSKVILKQKNEIRSNSYNTYKVGDTINE